MAMFLMTVKVKIDLPEGETPAEQDPSLVLTGENWDPWPGVHIHDVDLVNWEAV